MANALVRNQAAPGSVRILAMRNCVRGGSPLPLCSSMNDEIIVFRFAVDKAAVFRNCLNLRRIHAYNA